MIKYKIRSHVKINWPSYFIGICVMAVPGLCLWLHFHFITQYGDPSTWPKTAAVISDVNLSEIPASNRRFVGVVLTGSIQLDYVVNNKTYHAIKFIRRFYPFHWDFEAHLSTGEQLLIKYSPKDPSIIHIGNQLDK